MRIYTAISKAQQAAVEEQLSSEVEARLSAQILDMCEDIDYSQDHCQADSYPVGMISRRETEV